MRILGSQLDDFDRYILASRIELIHVSRALTSVVIFVVAFHLSGIRWTLDVALFTLTTILSGTLIMFTLMLISATVALWTTKSGKLTDLLISATKEATVFPISIYPLAVRLLLTFVLPVAFVTYYPAQQLLQKDEFGAPVVALMMLCVSYSLWCSGLRRYHSTGS